MYKLLLSLIYLAGLLGSIPLTLFLIAVLLDEIRYHGNSRLPIAPLLAILVGFIIYCSYLGISYIYNYFIFEYAMSDLLEMNPMFFLLGFYGFFPIMAIMFHDGFMLPKISFLGYVFLIATCVSFGYGYIEMLRYFTNT